MKKLNLLIAFMAIAMIGFVMIGCSDEDAVGPKIVLVAEGNSITADAIVTAGSTFTVAWLATAGDANLASFTITRDDQNLTGYPLEDIPKDDYTGSATLTALNAEGTNVYKLIVTDKDDLSAEVVLNITVEAAETPLTTEVTTGVIGHLYGPLDGAWDLVADVSKNMGAADADKDMINLSSGSGVTFVSGFEAGNSTMFVKDNTIDYDNVTQEDAEEAYDAGTAANQIATVAVDDIIVAKLRGSADDYAVIKITLVNATFTGKSAPLAGDGKIEFSYKK